MTDTPDATGGIGGRFSSLDTVEKLRFAAFSLLALAIVTMNLALTPPDLLVTPLTGWVQDLGVHQVHDMTVFGVMWVFAIVPAALLLYRPTRRVNTVLAPVVFAVPTAVMAFLVDSFLFVPFLVTSVIALLALVFHPAGRDLLRVDRVSVDRRLVGLYLVGAVPLALYGGFELATQLGPADEHTLFVHNGGMAQAAFAAVLFGGLAVVRRRDWRFAVWSAGLVTAFVGAASVGYPTSPSSMGLLGGALAVLWAAALVASVESVQGRGSDPEAVDAGEPFDEGTTDPV